MPKILMTGENTFRVVEDDYEERVDTPTPPISPNPNSPTHQLKRDTLRENPYTEEAASKMMRTPVNYDLGTPDKGYFGKYFGNAPQSYRLANSSPGTIGVNRRVQLPIDIAEQNNRSVFYENPSGGPTDTLAHEFGHKWYYEDLAPRVRNEWGRDYENIMGEDYAPVSESYWGEGGPVPEPRVQSAITRMVHGPGANRQPSEMYAEWSSEKPGSVPEQYYPGLYRNR